MNKRFVGVLTFAFLVAAGASLVLYRVLINRPASAKPGPALAQVALATKDLEVGSVLKEEDVKVAEWPGAVPVGATTQVKDIVGRGVITAIFAKEPIIESRLAPKGAGGGMAAMIPPGMRAVAVRVNEVVGVAGFVVPGTHVDMLISGNTPGGNGNLGTLTQTLLQNIEVLSAGQDFKKDAEGKPVMVQVVNMLVTPDAGRATQPGGQPDQHSTGAAQSAGSRYRQDSRDRAPASLRQWKAAAAASIGNVTAPANRTARRADSGAYRGAARPAQGSSIRDGDHFRARPSGNRNSAELRRSNKCRDFELQVSC